MLLHEDVADRILVHLVKVDQFVQLFRDDILVELIRMILGQMLQWEALHIFVVLSDACHLAQPEHCGLAPGALHH